MLSDIADPDLVDSSLESKNARPVQPQARGGRSGQARRGPGQAAKKIAQLPRADSHEFKSEARKAGKDSGRDMKSI